MDGDICVTLYFASSSASPLKSGNMDLADFDGDQDKIHNVENETVAKN